MPHQALPKINIQRSKLAQAASVISSFGEAIDVIASEVAAMSSNQEVMSPRL